MAPGDKNKIVPLALYLCDRHEYTRQLELLDKKLDNLIAKPSRRSEHRLNLMLTTLAGTFGGAVVFIIERMVNHT